MSNYIGNQPSQGEFKKLDSIASSFNGSLTEFDLDFSGTQQSVGDSTQLIVSLNGIVQEPGSAYTLGIGGSTIIFASAPVSGDTCHIVLLGGVGQTSTPSDGSVTASKLDAALKDYYEDEFTASGSTTYTLSREAVGVNQLMVTIDGIVQPTSAYSASGSTLTISPALPTGTNIRVVHMGVKAGVYVPAQNSIGLTELDLTATDARYYQSGDSIDVATIDSDVINIENNNPRIRFDDTDTSNNGEITLDNTQLRIEVDEDDAVASSQIKFRVDGDDKVTIDASGNVGIGTTGPSQQLHVYNTSSDAQLLIQSTATGGDGRLSLNAGSGGVSQIRFGDDIASNVGLLTYDHSDNSMSFRTNLQTRMTIDSGGNLLVGTTDVDLGYTDGDAGIVLRNDGVIQVARDETSGNNGVLYVNKLNGSGKHIVIYTDGAQLGAIGTEGGDSLWIGNTDTGLKFAGGADVVQPFDPSSNSARDAAIDFGTSGARFKDLYLSGGVYLGGTDANHYLDDYEKGTWTPTAGDNVGTVAQADGIYTKIGRMVHAQFIAQITVNSTGSRFQIAGLPFTTADYTTATAVETTGVVFQDDSFFLSWVLQNSTGIPYIVVESTKPLNGSAAGSGGLLYRGSIWYNTND